MLDRRFIAVSAVWMVSTWMYAGVWAVDDVSGNSADAKTQVQNVQSLFAQATNAAVMRNGFPALLKLFAGSVPDNPATQSLLDTGAPAAGREGSLAQSIDQFNRDWKQKYGGDFHVNDASLVFADITPADILGPAQLAAGKIAGPLTTRPAPQNTASATLPKLDAIEVNVPTVMGTHPGVAHLVRVGNAFRFATANGAVDAAALAGAIQEQLKQLSQQKNRWPIDSALAQRLVTQHVIESIAKVTGAAPTTQPAN